MRGILLFLQLHNPAGPSHVRPACTVEIKPSGPDGYQETRKCGGSIHVRQHWDRLLWGNQGAPDVEIKRFR